MSKMEAENSGEKTMLSKKKKRKVEKPPPVVYMTPSQEEEEFKLWARLPTFRRGPGREEALATVYRAAEKAAVHELRPVYEWRKRIIKQKRKVVKVKSKEYEVDDKTKQEEEEEVLTEVIDTDQVEREALSVDTSPFERQRKSPVGKTYVIIFPDTSLTDVALREDRKFLDKDPDKLSDISGHSSLSDPGNERAFKAPGGTQRDFRDDVGENHYRYLCKQLDVVPSQHFIRQLKSGTASLRYYGLDPRGVRPIVEALSKNKYVKYLDLEDNWLTYDSAYHLAKLFHENNTIERLNLDGCRLGPESAWKISEFLAETRRLKELVLSNNNLGDVGAEALAHGIGDNMSVVRLNLSHNQMGRRAGIALGAAMEENWTLRTLDLSWNMLFDKDGVKKLVEGLIKNQSIQTLILAGNAMGEEVLRSLRQLIAYNKVLSNLDLRFNRISDRCLSLLKRPVSRNKNIRVLKIGYNPITFTAASDFLAAIQKVPDNGLLLLDMEAVWVDSKFKQIEQEIKQGRKFRTITAGVVSDYPIKQPDQTGLLLKRAYFEGMSPKKKKQKKDFGHFLLKAPKKSLPLKKFIQRLREERFKIQETLLEELGRQFFDEKRRVDVIKMRDKYLEYFPDTALPVPKEKKKKKDKKSKKSKKSTIKKMEEDMQVTEPPPEGEPEPVDEPPLTYRDVRRPSMLLTRASRVSIPGRDLIM